jgi:hypothetical protein
MKVKELIVQLLEMNQDADVSFQIAEGCCGDYDYLGDPDLDEVPYHTRTNEEKTFFVNFRFPALDHMTSCISTGIAKRAVERHRMDRDPVTDSNSIFAHAQYIKELNEKKKNGEETT